MRQCERCDGEVSWTDDTVTLASGYLVHLCTACERDLNDLILESDEGRELDMVVARHEHYRSLATAGTPVTLEMWQEQVASKTRADRAICALTRLFLTSKPVTADREED